MALYHIQSTCAESDIGLKICGYCSALESLFSTSNAELTHQLSERLAFFISGLPQERLEIYKKAKQAYSVRSRIVHGGLIGEKELANIKELSYFCDSSLRKVIFKLMSDENAKNHFSGKFELVDDYMQKLIFGVYVHDNSALL